MDREGEIEAAMTRVVAERGADKTICPSEVARAVAGPDPRAWRALMDPVKRVALRLAGRGTVVVLRKGEPVTDPAGPKGIYRIGTPREGS